MSIMEIAQMKNLQILKIGMLGGQIKEKVKKHRSSTRFGKVCRIPF